ncbi:MAG: hypothetical protein WC553_02020 [Patescibacteria group bacterium]
MPILIAWLIEHWLIAVVVGVLAVGGTVAVVSYQSDGTRHNLVNELTDDLETVTNPNTIVTPVITGDDQSVNKNTDNTGSSSASANQTPWGTGPSDQGLETTGTGASDQQAPWNQGPSQ